MKYNSFIVTHRIFVLWSSCWISHIHHGDVVLFSKLFIRIPFDEKLYDLYIVKIIFFIYI